jgi:hypothetical protein
MIKSKDIYFFLLFGMVFCFDAHTESKELIELLSIYKTRQNTVAWVNNVVAKSDALISKIKKTNDDEITSSTLLDFSLKSDDFACRSFSFINDYSDLRQANDLKSAMKKRGNVFLLLANRKAKIERADAIAKQSKEFLKSLYEEEGISEEDIDSDSEDIISSRSSSPISTDSDS